VRDPIDASQQSCLVHVWSWRQRKLEDDLRLYSWLSETHERERITDLGEVVYRTIVDISPDRSIYVVFGPNRAIREANLASHRHLAAHLAHLPYCSSHAVSIVKIERRKARGEWRDLVAGIEDGERLGGNRLKFGQGGCFIVGHYANMRVDWEKYSTRLWASNRGFAWALVFCTSIQGGRGEKVR
jgi:hypothetical protein